MAEKVRVRFAPSPTGYLHVGGARSALFNYLFARRHGGEFLLRIEDTDRTRFVEGALTEIYDSLRWLGLDWDEGPGKEGDCGPYVQSERLHIYKDKAARLIQSGHAYRCFCTSGRLAEVRAAQEKAGGATGYDRRCRDLPAAEIERNLAGGVPHVVRLKIPMGRTVAFEDLIRGKIEYRSDVLDDLVLIKADGFPTYHMANVVDDHEMRITHVLRGDEWISSTPRHVLLYEAFGWAAPAFAHLPVILSPDGGKLSKRKGAASVMDYKRGGFLPEALFNFLALLGWAPGDDREKMPVQEMIEAFSLEQVSPKAAVLDEKKLEWMNGTYMAERPPESLAADVMAMWKERGYEAGHDYAVRVIDLMKVRSRRITELVDTSSYFFVDPVEYEEKAAKKHFNADAAGRLALISEEIEGIDDFTHAKIEEVYRSWSESQQLSISSIIHPTRLAISGVSAGPGLFELMEVIGKDRVLKRISAAIKFICG
ncbi:MAG: glutamate--tRNA ligase [Chitinispirillia bacterium]|nr:glutamate--tRNA ligase [Chitinispirillia bacterium]MCL2241934.1 glutamate--tRNA ligase [Chitinispirillia bacterium]